MHSSRFLRLYLLFLALFVLPLLSNIVFIARTGEFLPLSTIVRTQQSSKDFCIYGTAFHNDTYAEKLAGFTEKKPTIAAIGSSRVMQVRSAFFNEPFHNLGGTVRSPDDIHNVITAMNAVHKPDIIFLNLDPWWFGDAYHAYYTAAPPPTTARINIRELFTPFQWLYDGKISLSTYRDIILRGPDPATCSIGLQAILRRDGNGPDGSRYNTSKITGSGPPLDRPFDIIDRENPAGLYVPHQALNEESVDALERAIDEIRASGTTVVVFLPPFAPSIRDAMTASKAYRYIDDLRAELRKRDLGVFDFSDPATIGTTDCEFLDDHHGGDVTYARMLRRIHDTTSVKTVRDSIDAGYLTTVITQYRGLAMIPDTRVTKAREVDFLGVGCKKQPAR